MGGGTPYVGQLILVPYNFAPNGWMLCQGQLVSISQYEVLFQLIGTTYGGDGQQTFALPDLRGRSAIGAGSGPGLQTYVQGQVGGAEQVTLTVQQIPTHSHAFACTAASATSGVPNGGVPAAGLQEYSTGAPTGNMNAGMMLPVGGSQPHDNRQPYLTLNWCISLYGVFPSQS